LVVSSSADPLGAPSTISPNKSAALGAVFDFALSHSLVANVQGRAEGVRLVADPNSPDPGRSTSEAAMIEIKREIARRNEEAQKAGREKRAAREKEQLARSRRLKW
jgi:hypothetical protein